ncbi:MAG: PKD domain-containing protein [Candidatus Latescibacteria bacterium]|nr:PKD domain-containing protein [Candidatus Latescibacterota bacterium]
MKQNVFLTLGIILLFVSGCLTGSDDGKDEPKVKDKKILSFNKSRIMLIENEQYDFVLKIEPPAEENEVLLWSFVDANSTVDFTTNAVKQSSLNAMGFKEKDLTLTVTLYDSLEFAALGYLAPDYGSASMEISVRKITVNIIAEPLATYLEYRFIASSPEQDYLGLPVVYMWDFGDGEIVEGKNKSQVTHTFTSADNYQVKIELSAVIHKGDDHFYTIAKNTKTINVKPGLADDLELIISPQDTTWNTASGLTLSVETNLNRLDYPDQIKWVIDYGDGESDEYEDYLDNRTISHRYYNNGDYTLDVAIFNLATKDLLTQDSAIIHINNLQFLLATNYLNAKIAMYSVRHFGKLASDGTFTQQSEEAKHFNFGGSVNNPLVWSGNTFSTQSIYETGTQTTTVTFTGKVSDDATEIVRLEYSYDYINTDYQGKEWTRLTRFVLEKVPLTNNSAYRYSRYESGSQIGRYVSGFEDWNKIYNPSNETADYNYMDNLDWQNNTLGEPEITIEFEKQ